LHIAQEFQCKDDGVSDTPLQQTQNFGCPTFPKKNCSNTGNGEMFMNYMDNTDDACQNLFTKGQTNLMRALFFSGGTRSRFFYRTDGNDAFCQNSTAIFSTPNPLCLAISWQVSGPIAIRSGQNTNSLTVAGIGVGTATITMRAGNYTDTRQIQVTSVNNVITGTYSSVNSTNALSSYNPTVLGTTTVRVNLTSATSFKWTSTSGNATWTGGSGTYTGSSIDFNLTSANSSIAFNVEATTPCGIINQTFSFAANSWSFRAAPNPATSTLRISGTQITQPTARVAETPLKFEMRLYDKYGQIVKYAKNVTGVTDLDIDVSGLKPDIYQLQIFKDKELTNQRIEIRR
jgi:hypothetical protein